MRRPVPIPFVDLVALHLEIQEELLWVFRTALRSGTFADESIVEDFEREFSRYCETRYCVGVSSGTDALRLALIAAGVRAGDVVLTVPNTFVATAEAIFQAGAFPDFIDIDPRSYNMDWILLQEHLETRCYMDGTTGRLLDKRLQRPVRAIVPVHLYGQMADMDPILEIAEQYNLIVIEDACQAHGAEYFSNKDKRWKKAGSMGSAAAFSFSPGEYSGACGEAGAVTTNDVELARRVRMMRDHGQRREHYHDAVGCNSKLDSLQAGILQTKLRHLPDWTRKLREDAFCYHGLLASAVDSVIIPYEPSWARSIYHMYAIRTDNREELRSHLVTVNIATRVHYPVPIHCQEAYRSLGYKAGDFPVTEKVASRILSLPMYPHLEFDQQYRVAQSVLEFGVQAKSRESRRHVLPTPQ
jgi:dTDP-4-amino-4,6-dideoxygalactose transaminase